MIRRKGLGKWYTKLMENFLAFILFPHESNNFRPKILHLKSLFYLVIFFFAAGLLLGSFKTSFPQVLGISANISVQDLVNIANQRRSENGLGPLVLNQQLSQAAAGKARDMLTQNYWSHNSPDGKTPWIFIKDAGYNYISAGENLARGYTSAPDIVNAWMASPEHRKNQLSADFKDVGFAVEEGVLGGEDTVLIVEMFGSSSPSIASVETPTQPTPVIQNQLPVPTFSPSATPTSIPTPIEQKSISQVAENNIPGTPSLLIASVKKEPIIKTDVLSKDIAYLITALLLMILISDLAYIERRKIIRFVGHNLDHIFFLTFILILISILAKGVIV